MKGALDAIQAQLFFFMNRSNNLSSHIKCKPLWQKWGGGGKLTLLQKILSERVEVPEEVRYRKIILSCGTHLTLCFLAYSDRKEHHPPLPGNQCPLRKAVRQSSLSNNLLHCKIDNSLGAQRERLLFCTIKLV